MSTPSSAPAPEPTDASWTAATRRFLERRLPLTHLLPSRQPFFVGSWVYVFGLGRFVNSIHFWGVQLFFFFVVLHLWGQFFMASWRDGRAKTWLVGVVIFVAGLVTGFTGYVSQQNLDAQWIAINAKDGINSTGAGSFFNVLDFGQMYGIHVMLLPIFVTMLVVLHVVQVRMRGVVKPIEPQVPAGRSNPPTDVAS